MRIGHCLQIGLATVAEYLRLTEGDWRDWQANVYPLEKIPAEVYADIDGWKFYGVDRDPHSIAYLSKKHGTQGHWINASIKTDTPQFVETDSWDWCRGIPHGNYAVPLTLQQVFEGFNLNELDVLAIDIEGAEFDALEQHDFNQISPRFISVEIHTYHNTADEGLRRIENCITPYGYRLDHTIPSNLDNKFPTLEAKFIHETRI